MGLIYLNMFDLKFIREHEKEIRDSMLRRGKSLEILDNLLKNDSEFRPLKQEVDELRHERNVISEKINEAKKKNQHIKKLILKAKSLPEELKQKELKLKELEIEISKLTMEIPNIIDKDVPKGKDASENKEIRKFGKLKSFDFEIKNHIEIAEKLGADFDVGRLNTGNGFNYLIGDMAELDLALVHYGLDFVKSKGFKLVNPPMMLRKEAIGGTININDFKDMIYKVEGEDLYLIGTAENSLVSLFKDKIFSEEELPVMISSYTPCFRKEIGAHGIDTKGLFRMHQFNKVEQVVFCKPEDSKKMLEKMQKISEELFRTLDLPFRTIEICSGDLGNKQAKQYDLELWSPRQEKYMEEGSASNCKEYQAIQLNTKYINNKGEKHYVHILNNTMIATPRPMVAILENFQNKDGSVTVPKPLIKYIGKNFLGKVDKKEAKKTAKKQKTKKTKKKK